jgi:hypothetical protein
LTWTGPTACVWDHEPNPVDKEWIRMSKRARKRRARKGSSANHGNRPNS